MAIPSSDGITLSDHIDSMILRALIDEKDNPDLMEGADRLLRTHEKPLEVCHVSIGEAFATMVEDNDRSAEDCSTAVRVFHNMVSTGDVSICGFHNHIDTHELALRLHKEDSRLEPNDGIILANAFLCKDCREFITTDSQMLVSGTVKSIAKDFDKIVKPLPVRDVVKNRKKTYGGSTGHR